MKLLDGELPGEATAPSTERMLYEQALEALPGLNPREAVVSIEQQSQYIQQVYVIAEQDGLAREYVLGMFPTPLDEVRETIHGN